MSSKTPSSEGVAAAGDFRSEFGTTARELRAALTGCLRSLDALGLTPQELARRLGLDKMLAWKISKLVADEEPGRWAQHVPGRAGMAKVAAAMGSHGASSADVDDLDQAAEAFEAMVTRHVGDRATLHAAVSGLQPQAHPGLLLEARRQAFKGNSGTLGLQAEAQLSTFILSRSVERPELADVVQLAGMLGFRRLRSDVRWPLFHRSQWTGEGAEDPTGRPLDPDLPDPDGFPWLRELSSSPLPPIEVRPDERGVSYALGPGPIGLTGAVDCSYALTTPCAGPARRTEVERTSEFGVNLLTPVSFMQLDLFVADDLGWEVSPEHRLVSRMQGGGAGPDEADHPIPSTVSVRELGRGLAGISNPRLPAYGELMRSVFKRAGVDPAGVSGWRLAMEVPPIPAMAMLTCRLPE